MLNQDGTEEYYQLILLANQPTRWKKQIAKQEILERRFYVEAYQSNYFPEGILRLYRLTSGISKDGKRGYVYHSVRIKNPEELAKTKPVLDYLAGKLKWQELPPLLKDLEEQLKKQEAINPEVLRIVRQYPRASISMLKAFDEIYHGKPDIEDVPVIIEFMNTAIKSLSVMQEGMIGHYLDLVGRLSEEKTPEGVKNLLRLLEEYTLPQIASVASIITDRLQKLNIFEVQIQNENAYEIKGKNSIHSQLANALWLLDDSYWLLHSNEPLANFLNKKYPTSENEKLRPDFICANNKADLVIVELKRPSHEINTDDIVQLQNYLVAVDEYGKYTDKRGFIIGKSISDHNRKLIDSTTKNIEFKSYVQLVDDCRRRYQEYLDAIEKAA